jgi:hydrogenase nickel incorporation protein HypA/HybF
MALAESVIEALEEQAASQCFSKVHAVWLEIGALAAVEREAMRFTFEVVARGTLAEAARLEIIESLGKAWCAPCAATVPVRRLGEACPRCGGHRLQILEGQHIRIKEIEVA